MPPIESDEAEAGVNGVGDSIHSPSAPAPATASATATPEAEAGVNGVGDSIHSPPAPAPAPSTASATATPGADVPTSSAATSAIVEMQPPGIKNNDVDGHGVDVLHEVMKAMVAEITQAGKAATAEPQHYPDTVSSRQCAAALNHQHVTGVFDDVPSVVTAAEFAKLEAACTRELPAAPSTCMDGAGRVDTPLGRRAVQYIFIPNGATIGPSMFSGSLELLGVIFGDKGVVAIGDGAFANCPKLRMIVNLTAAKNAVQSVGARVFTGCPLLIAAPLTRNSPSSRPHHMASPTVWRVDVKPDWITSTFLGPSEGVPTTDRAAGTKDASGDACGSARNGGNCSRTLHTLPANAFRNNVAVVSIVVPNGVVEIGSHAFANCPNLTTVTLPTTVQKIGANAFANSGIASLSLPDSVDSIGASAFKSCHHLTELAIPPKVKRLSLSTMAYCTGLRMISFPEGLEEIECNAFRSCIGLEEIVIPNSVTRIENHAFSYCTSVKNVVVASASCKGRPFFGGGSVALCQISDDAVITVKIDTSFKIAGLIAFLDSVSAKKRVVVFPTFLKTMAGDSIQAPPDTVIEAGDSAAKAFATVGNVQTLMLQAAADALDVFPEEIFVADGIILYRPSIRVKVVATVATNSSIASRGRLFGRYSRTKQQQHAQPATTPAAPLSATSNTTALTVELARDVLVPWVLLQLFGRAPHVDVAPAIQYACAKIGKVLRVDAQLSVMTIHCGTTANNGLVGTAGDASTTAGRERALPSTAASSPSAGRRAYTDARGGGGEGNAFASSNFGDAETGGAGMQQGPATLLDAGVMDGAVLYVSIEPREPATARKCVVM